MSDIDVKLLLPRNLRIDFYNDLADSISTELKLLKTEISILQEYFNTRELNDTDLLLELLSTFGYIPNFSVHTDIPFIKNEANSLIFKVRKKTTYPIYDYFFKSIPRLGYVYNLFNDGYGYGLIKALDFTTINTNLNNQNYGLPFTGLVPEYYYSFLLNDPFSLDHDPLFYLDDGNYLDSNVVKETTHHLSIEISPITIEFSPYYMTLNYLDFLLYSANYSRKVTEVPHVGVQYNLITDNSRYYNNLNGGLPYTVPALLSKFAVTQDYVVSIKENMFYKLCAGTGIQPMFGITDPLGTIYSLANEVYCKYLSPNESTDIFGTWFGINANIRLNTVKDYTTIIADGITYIYNGNLLYQDIIPKTYSLTYTYAGNNYTISDTNGDGILSDVYFNGSIDYTLGTYNLQFYNTFSSGITSLTTNPAKTIITSTLINPNVILDSFTITYAVLGTTYVAYSNSSGIITGTYISSGTITLGGILNITFSHALDSTTATCIYNYIIYEIPTNMTNILMTYQTRQAIHITEYGIKDVNDNLIAYATVPACDLPDSFYHYSINMFIKI
jgi:hypothetical protein